MDFFEVQMLYFILLTANFVFLIMQNIMEFDFKRYHIRSMNAASAEERAQINQELKDLYASLNPEDQARFNQELQVFLTREVGRIKSDYESINGLGNPN